MSRQSSEVVMANDDDGDDPLPQVPLLRVVNAAGLRGIGSEAGAAYVLAVPIDVDALLRRLVAIQRASRASAPRRRVRFVGWELDVIKRRLTVPGGGVITLRGLEFALLSIFVEQPGRTFTRDELVRSLQTDGRSQLTARTVDSYVCRLRRRLGQSGSEAIVATVHGVGYAFKADVKRV